MTREFAHVEISGAGFVPDSGDSESGDVTLSGRVTVVTATEMEVDSCPAFADCDAMVTKLLVTASGLELGAAIPVGALVSLHYRKMCAVTCTTDLVVTSLDGWGGYTNAVRAPSGIYLAVDEGGAYEAMPEFPFTVERVRLDCPSNFPSGGCPVLSPGLYALRFYERSGGSVLVSMGETSFYGLAGSLSVRNLRSYSTGECDLYYDWAFWIAGEWAD